MNRQTSEAPPLAEEERLTIYVPRTSLGKRLWDIRSQILASGTRPLSWDQIETEVAEERQGRGFEG